MSKTNYNVSKEFAPRPKDKITKMSFILGLKEDFSNINQRQGYLILETNIRPNGDRAREVILWCGSVSRILRENLLMISPITFINNQIGYASTKEKLLHTEFKKRPIGGTIIRITLREESWGVSTWEGIRRWAINVRTNWWSQFRQERSYTWLVAFCRRKMIVLRNVQSMEWLNSPLVGWHPYRVYAHTKCYHKRETEEKPTS